jgi:hypothetical protein
LGSFGKTELRISHGTDKSPGILAGNIGEPIKLEKVEPLSAFPLPMQLKEICVSFGRNTDSHLIRMFFIK